MSGGDEVRYSMLQLEPCDGPALSEDHREMSNVTKAKMMGDVCVRLGLEGTVWCDIEYASTCSMTTFIQTYGVVRLRIYPLNTDDNPRILLVYGNWLVWMPHEYHWPPRVVPRTAEFDHMFALCVSGREWSLAEARLLLADGGHKSEKWLNSHLKFSVASPPFRVSGSNKTAMCPPLSWLRTRHYCSYCCSVACHCTSIATKHTNSGLEKIIPAALIGLTSSYLTANDHAHFLQTCRRVHAAATLPEASPYRLHYYVRGKMSSDFPRLIPSLIPPLASLTLPTTRVTLPTTSVTLPTTSVTLPTTSVTSPATRVISLTPMNKIYTVLPRHSPRLLTVENIDGPYVLGYNQAAACFWNHVGSMRTLTELDMRLCAWATWFRPQSQCRSLDEVKAALDERKDGKSPREDTHDNEEAVVRFSNLGSQLPRLVRLRLANVCAHPALSFESFRSLTVLEAGWLEAHSIRQLPTSLTSLSIELTCATSPATAVTQKELVDAFLHLMPTLRVLNLPTGHPSVALALALLPFSRGLDRLGCSSAPGNRKPQVQRREMVVAKGDAHLLTDPMNVERFCIVRDLGVHGVTAPLALTNLLTIENKHLERLDIEAYRMVTFPTAFPDLVDYIVGGDNLKIL
jgi:hypothetical protein